MTSLLIAAVGLVCGLAIYIVFVKMPVKVQGLEQTEKLVPLMPGMNCGACGYPGCFGYAQAMAKNPELVKNCTCAALVNDSEKFTQLCEAIGIKVDASAMNKKALIHCGGNSEVAYSYAGADTCKAADQLLGGYKKCPYGCLGLGDCAKVCPQDAISIDPERNIAVVDWEKCIGCGLCLAECPHGLIELVPAGTKVAFKCNYQPLRDIPGREKCESGCIHCRKCFNACEFDAIIWNKQKAIPEFDMDKCVLCMKCVKECPNSVLEKVFMKAKKKEPAKAAA